MLKRGSQASVWVGVMAALFVAERHFEQASLAQQPSPVPRYEVDPFWPKMPDEWILGQVAGITVDARDHVWLIQRPWSLESAEKAGNP